MKSEKDIQREVQVAASEENARLFRNNVGLFRSWHGNRPVRCGLARGSSDLVGWRSVVITQEMVGKTFAQFLSVEIKTLIGREAEHQENWRHAVNLAGGLAFVARSVKGFLGNL